MVNKNRLARLENTLEPNRPTWKDFITGAWQPSPQEWQAFILQSEISFQVLEESGGATVHFFDGHKEQVKQPLDGVKAYSGIDPSQWGSAT